jgi:hypothetical protein
VGLTKSAWKESTAEFLDGIERELGSTAPAESVAALNVFRMRLGDDRTLRRRKQFDRDLEVFLESKPYLKVAARRHLRKKIGPAVKSAMILLERANVVLAKYQKKKRGETA